MNREKTYLLLLIIPIIMIFVTLGYNFINYNFQMRGNNYIILIILLDVLYCLINLIAIKLLNNVTIKGLVLYCISLFLIISLFSLSYNFKKCFAYSIRELHIIILNQIILCIYGICHYRKLKSNQQI